MSRKRANKAELIKRREKVQELILLGIPKARIVDQITVEWETTARAVHEDIRIIGQKWKEKAPEAIQKSRNKYLDRLEMMYSAALEGKNMKLALEIQKEINKLSGLYAEKEETKDEAPKFINIGKKPKLTAVSNGE